MEEIKKTEEKPEEISKPLSPIQSAHDAAEKLRIENERMEANIKKLEEIKAFEMLGGKSEGKEQEQIIKEETPQEYTKRVMSGKL